MPYNFIVIVSDTLRRDFLGCYGGTEADTRHIDAFAGQSVIFDRAYSASFPTVPHRRDVMTGKYTFTYTPWAPLTRQEPVVSEMLRRQGYMSMMISDTPHTLENGYGFDRGFDGFEWIRGQESDRWKTSPLNPPLKCDPSKIRNPRSMTSAHYKISSEWKYEEDRFAARTMSTACKWLEDNRGIEPFFLYVDTFDPHEPWDAPQWLIDKFDPGYAGEVVDYPRYEYVKEFLTPEELRHCRALYAAEVTLVDRWVGRLLERIEDMGLFDNTIVILTTDHGFLHGEHGLIGKSLIRENRFSYVPLFEEITHIPWIVHYPFCAPRRTDAIVQPPDIPLTLLDYSGADEDGLDGVSFRNALEEKGGGREFAVACPYAVEGGAAAVQATVTFDRWSAILSGKLPQRVRESDSAVDGSSKRIGESDPPSDMLFDLSADPRQEKDIASEHPEIIREARKMLLQLLKDSNMKEEAVDLWR